MEPLSASEPIRPSGDAAHLPPGTTPPARRKKRGDGRRAPPEQKPPEGDVDANGPVDPGDASEKPPTRGGAVDILA